VNLVDTVRSGSISGCVALLVVVSSGGQEAVHAAADTSSAASSPGQLFGVHPVQQGTTTLPGGHFNFALVSGQSISDGIVVENFSDRALTFRVYGADLLTAAGGGLAPAQPTATMHEVGAWITISAPTVAIPAHSQVTDYFTLRVPVVVSPGEHPGAVVAAANVGLTSQGSTIEARTALITVVTVPGIAHPSARLNSLSESIPIPGQTGFGITLSNTGNVLLTYSGSLAIDDGDRHRIANLPLTPINAYVVPDGQVSLAATWKELVPQDAKYRAQATVTILADGRPVATLTSQSLALPFSSGIPMLMFVGLAVASVGILLFAAWRVRRGIRRRSRTSSRGAFARRLSGVK
jgi:hypothetical protein